jgi:hypothetical protein
MGSVLHAQFGLGERHIDEIEGTTRVGPRLQDSTEPLFIGDGHRPSRKAREECVRDSAT